MNPIYLFWTEDNSLSENRLNCLRQIKEETKCDIKLITRQNLSQYILKEHPLHEGYQYLSATHKADYLRTYFMHFHGGGYADIKFQSGSWVESFEILKNSDKWMVGYAEIAGGVVYPPLVNSYDDLVGNGAYIFKPQTPLTLEWYSEMLCILDTKLENLKLHPAKYPRDCSEDPNSNYPIGWVELLGNVFHKICYKYKDKLIRTLPIPIFIIYN